MSSGKLLVEGRRPRTCCGICIQCWPAFSCFWYLVHDIELTLCCFQCPPTKICSQSELFISLLSKWATFHSVPSDTFLFELTLMGKYEKDSICWIINSLKWTLFSYKSILEAWNQPPTESWQLLKNIHLSFFHLGGLTHGKVFTFNISYQIADWSCNFMSIQSSALSVDKFITLKPPMPHLSFFFFNMEL